VSAVKYELGFYIPEDDILHSHRRDNLKPYISANCLENVKSLMPRQPIGLHGLILPEYEITGVT
jgi:hypothetical protein